MGSQTVPLCVLCKDHVLTHIGTINDHLYPPSFQIPQRHPDDVPAHLALPDHSDHYKQGCPQASAGPEGLGEGHPAGNAPLLCRLPSVFTKVKGRLLTTSPNGSANTSFPAQAVCVQMYFIHCIILNIGVLTNT